MWVESGGRWQDLKNERRERERGRERENERV